MARLVLRLFLIATLLVPLAAEAARVVVCKRFCAFRIAHCIAAGGRPARCRRAFLQGCRRDGIDACEQPTTTTTTTTLPRGSYHGTWDFSGFLVEDTCGWADYSVRDTATVSQPASSPSATASVGSWPGAVLSGGLGADGAMTLSGDTARSDGCAVRVVISIGTQIGATVPGAAGFGVACLGYRSCHAVYGGTWTRR